MKNKGKSLKLTNLGFTLIELLAVIVILAIIAIIAVPIILNIIDDSKKESAEISAENYIEAVEIALARENANGEFNPSKCKIQNTNGTSKLICDGEELKLEIDGSVPQSGIISIKEYKIKYYALYIDKSTVRKIDGKVEVVVGKDETNQVGDIDVNGKLEEADVILLSKSLIKYLNPNSSLPIEENDVNGDGKVTTLDVNLLSKNVGYVKTVPGILGDVNSDGEITSADVDLLQQYSTHQISDSEITLSNSDINGDGQANVIDATVLKNLLSK